MQRILLAVDALDANSNNALEFACYMAKLSESKLTAVFLENMVEEESHVSNSYRTGSSVSGSPGSPYDEHIAKVKQIDDNIQRFREACNRREVDFCLSRDRGMPLYELIEESRFADVLILEATTSFSERFEGVPSRFVKDILSQAECPVIIAPESFESIDELVFSYDGSASSAFAIKEFTHIFPQFRHTRVNIVEVTKNESDDDSDKYLFDKWLAMHYSDTHFQLMRGDSDTLLFEYLFKKENVLIVMGSYGRNYLSQLFRKSHADLIIKTVTQPIFVSHP